MLYCPRSTRDHQRNVLFFGGLNSFGLGLIGEYMWRTFENTKGRPTYVVARQHQFKGEKKLDG